MTRFLSVALLASAALPTAAWAQEDNERPRTAMERREAGPRPDRPARAERMERVERVDRPAQADRPAMFERAPRPDRQSFAPPSVQQPQQPQFQPQATRPDRQDRGAWQGRRDDNRAERGDRGGRREPGDGSFTAPGFGPSAAREIPGNDAWNQGLRSDTTGRGGAINRARDQQRRDWDRNRGNDRRDWDRGRNDDRRDWNRGRDDGRNWADNRRWDGNNRNVRNWDRGWRSDRRYDWQRYRDSNRSAYRLPRYYAPSNWGYGYRRFDVGAYLFAGLYGQNYWIDDPWSFRLPPVDWPYQWVRYYDDALLVDTRTGYVVDSIPGIFW